MSLYKIASSALVSLATLALAGSAFAGGRNAGSLLLFPEFDNRTSNLTLVTVTNVNPGVGNPGSADGTVKVEFVYIGKYGPNSQPLNCLEFNRTETLTANDTLSVITSVHNPQQEQGYLYVFAKDRITGKPISFNFLIGNVLTIQGIETLEYSMNPVVFAGVPAFGANTDLENGGAGDGIRDLDGAEYEKVTTEILIPRFIGSGGPNGSNSGPYNSELILVGLSGGASFQTMINFWVYNDNEEAFSAQYTFHCWQRVPLKDINGVFTQGFLRSTGHAANEIVGANKVESGWMRIYGGTAWSTAESIADPAIYAVLVEKISSVGAADLPFESTVLQANGDLLPRGVFGDPSGNNADNQ